MFAESVFHGFASSWLNSPIETPITPRLRRGMIGVWASLLPITEKVALEPPFDGSPRGGQLFGW